MPQHKLQGSQVKEGQQQVGLHQRQRHQHQGDQGDQGGQGDLLTNEDWSEGATIFSQHFPDGLPAAAVADEDAKYDGF